MKQNLETEVRALWQQAYNPLCQDEQDVFFDELFDAKATTVVRDSASLAVAAAQWSEHKMTFVGQPISVGLISGLTVSDALKPAARTEKAAQLLNEIHHQQYKCGMMLSLIAPADKAQRTWLESQGYMTVTHQLSVETRVPEDFVADARIIVTEADEWGRDLWIYYAQHAGGHDFELRLTEPDFFALLAFNDLRDGHLLVARRHGKICGLALAQREGKPLKSGKPSSKQFRMNIKYILASDAQVFYSLQQYAATLASDCKQVVITGGCPAKGFKGAVPSVMMRAIDVERFLKFVAAQLPGLQLTVGIDTDTAIPENNRSYRLRDGRCYVSDDPASSMVSPGGIPAMLLAGQPVQIPSL